MIKLTVCVGMGQFKNVQQKKNHWGGAYILSLWLNKISHTPEFLKGLFLRFSKFHCWGRGGGQTF